MDVTVILDDPPEIRLDDVHPVNLQDAVNYAVDAALRLSRELQPADGPD